VSAALQLAGELRVQLEDLRRDVQSWRRAHDDLVSALEELASRGGPISSDELDDLVTDHAATLWRTTPGVPWHRAALMRAQRDDLRDRLYALVCSPGAEDLGHLATDDELLEHVAALLEGHKAASDAARSTGAARHAAPAPHGTPHRATRTSRRPRR